MKASAYIGRVGALAVFLGVGAAVGTGQAAVAWADNIGSSSGGGAAARQPSDTGRHAQPSTSREAAQTTATASHRVASGATARHRRFLSTSADATADTNTTAPTAASNPRTAAPLRYASSQVTNDGTPANLSASGTGTTTPTAPSGLTTRTAATNRLNAARPVVTAAAPQPADETPNTPVKSAAALTLLSAAHRELFTSAAIAIRQSTVRFRRNGDHGAAAIHQLG